MKRALAFGVLSAFLFTAGLASADEKPGQKKPGPPGKGRLEGKGKGQMGEAMFKRLDADGDGKISKDEFKKMAEMGPGGKLKDHPQLLDKMFERLDANGDGSISADEFKKLGEGLKGKAGGKPGDKKPPVKKPGDDK